MRLALAVMSVLAAFAMAPAGHAADADRVVYHFSDGLEQATDGLRYIRNHVETDPAAKIVVVAHAAGVNFLLRGAKDKNGNEYAATIEDLTTAGVEFRACRITLTSRNIDPKQLHDDARLVPSGVVEIARLQAREGYAYVKP